MFDHFDDRIADVTSCRTQECTATGQGTKVSVEGFIDLALGDAGLVPRPAAMSTIEEHSLDKGDV
jgi:hypothetical protein